MNRIAKLTPVAAAVLLSGGLQAEESKLDGLSVSGFIDMSYFQQELDGGESSHSAGLDQVEINLGYDFGNKLSATVDVEYQNAAEGVDVEQAFISYALSDSFSIKAGRFLSYTGWETEEPTGLFQYSGTGYASTFYGYYQQGVSAYYSGDGFAAAVSVVNDLAGPLATDFEKPGVETMLAFMPSDEITIKGFYSKEGDVELINTWASYAAGALTLAVEFNAAENSRPTETDAGMLGSDASGYLLMANYAFDNAGITVRYHDYEVENDNGVVFEEQTGITISPSYTVNDNLLMVFEYRIDDNGAAPDADSIAVEALITF